MNARHELESGQLSMKLSIITPIADTMTRSSRVAQKPRRSGLESDICQHECGNVTHTKGRGERSKLPNEIVGIMERR